MHHDRTRRHGAAILTVTRTHRDLLWPEIERWAGIGEPLPYLGKDAAKAQRDRRGAEARFVMLDWLGWETESDCETFTVSVQDYTRAILEEHLADEANQVRQDLPMHREQLDRLQAEVAEARMVSDTVEESRERVASTIEHDERLLAVYHDLLAQLGELAQGMTTADDITISAHLLHELRHGAVWSLGAEAETLHSRADRLADEHDQDDRHHDFWEPAECVERLVLLAGELRVFTGERPTHIDGQHRRALVEAVKAQIDYRRSFLGDFAHSTSTEDVRTLLDTVDALEAFAAELESVEVTA